MDFQSLTALLPGSFGVVLATMMLVTFAEMADKTQLLTLALTAKYQTRYVWSGIFWGSVLSHGLAVLAGQIFWKFMQHVSELMPIIAGILFVFFAFWGLLESESASDEPSVHSKTVFGPILTIMGTFFIAELGDKTQIMSLTLAASVPHAATAVFCGAVIGMMLANGIAVLLGSFLGKKMPETFLKWVSSVLFLAFGIMGSFESLSRFLGAYFSIFIVGLTIAVFVTVGLGRRKRV